jgi:hypothetical protein
MNEKALAHWGGGSLSTKNTAQKEGKESASRPGRSLLLRKTRYTLYRRMGGPQGRSGQVRKILLPTGIRSPDPPARSESLYRLSYPSYNGTFQNFINTFCEIKILPFNNEAQSTSHKSTNASYLFATFKVIVRSNLNIFEFAYKINIKIFVSLLAMH